MVSPKVSLTPRYEAVKVTDVGTATVPAVTVKPAELAPCGTVTLDGMLAAVDDEVSAIVTPPLGAADVRVTVQDDPAGGVTDMGLHENPFKPSGCMIVTVPPVVEVDNDAAAESADPAFASWSCDVVSVVVLERVKDTVATTPSEIVVESTPHTTHLGAPATLLQEIDLFAAVATGPTAIVADAISAAE